MKNFFVIRANKIQNFAEVLDDFIFHQGIVGEYSIINVADIFDRLENNNINNESIELADEPNVIILLDSVDDEKPLLSFLEKEYMGGEGEIHVEVIDFIDKDKINDFNSPQDQNITDGFRSKFDETSYKLNVLLNMAQSACDFRNAMKFGFPEINNLKEDNESWKVDAGLVDEGDNDQFEAFYNKFMKKITNHLDDITFNE